MKRFSLRDIDQYGNRGMVEEPDGLFVAHTEAQAEIEALTKQRNDLSKHLANCKAWEEDWKLEVKEHAKTKQQLAEMDRSIENYKQAYERCEEIIAQHERDYNELMEQAVKFASAFCGDFMGKQGVEIARRAQDFLDWQAQQKGEPHGTK